MANCTFDLIYTDFQIIFYIWIHSFRSPGSGTSGLGNMKENRLKGKLDCLDCKNSMRDQVWKEME